MTDKTQAEWEAQSRASDPEGWAHTDALRRNWRSLGWTVAGGIWGEAAWKQLAPDLVVGLSDNTMGIPDPRDPRPIVVWVYRPPFYEGWTIDDGEAPSGCDDDHPNAEHHEFASVGSALNFVETLRMKSGSGT